MTTEAKEERRINSLEKVCLSRPHVYSYDDLSSYLRAYSEYKRSYRRGWSLRAWSRRLGLRGGGTLSNFIAGRRLLSDDLLEKVRMDLELSQYERVYFDALLLARLRTLDPVWSRLRIWLAAEDALEHSPP